MIVAAVALHSLVENLALPLNYTTVCSLDIERSHHCVTVSPNCWKPENNNDSRFTVTLGMLTKFVKRNQKVRKEDLDEILDKYYNLLLMRTGE